MTTHARSHKSGPVLTFADTSQVFVDGCVVPLGAAVRAVMRKRGWLHVDLSTCGRVATITDVHGGGQEALILCEPMEEVV